MFDFYNAYGDNYQIEINSFDVVNVYEEETLSVDLLLDEYNDYMRLYGMFGDQKYKDFAEEALMTLKTVYQYV
ncbi:hypothetical protein [Halobacillus litoralis]|uniref:hypothetical protein n=1 Tax=Halobacillus litoralis TaxID=45668 RepID=UPI001CD60DE7|nr:hypothetical protein [Halobacillus litoralis]MCA1021599.1 hypothetical protein [Halobacillus litoralis]